MNKFLFIPPGTTVSYANDDHLATKFPLWSLLKQSCQPANRQLVDRRWKFHGSQNQPIFVEIMRRGNVGEKRPLWKSRERRMGRESFNKFWATGASAEISMDATIAAVLSSLDGIFAWTEWGFSWWGTLERVPLITWQFYYTVASDAMLMLYGEKSAGNTNTHIHVHTLAWHSSVPSHFI